VHDVGVVVPEQAVDRACCGSPPVRQTDPLGNSAGLGLQDVHDPEAAHVLRFAPPTGAERSVARRRIVSAVRGPGRTERGASGMQDAPPDLSDRVVAASGPRA
jgi:hypothetical protein